MAWHGLATVFYITAKKRGESYAQQMIRDLLTWATVATVGQNEAQEALVYGITDYEDALIAASASAVNADWLITRGEAGFSKGPVLAVNPADFLLKL